MQYGVLMFLTDYSMSPPALARAAEERGFESLWVPEHTHIPSSRRSPWPGGPELPKMYYDVMDPFVCLAAAAVVTERLLLGTGICLVVQRDPIQTAKEVATLDRLSHGRFLFGVGGGWNAEEMADHGTEWKTRFRLMRERIEAMKVIWQSSEPEYHGETVRFDKMRSWPKPVQQPHPPIHVGGGFPHGARRAVQYGDGWIPIAGRGGDVAALLPAFRALAEEAGRDPADLEVSVYGAPADPVLIQRYAHAGVHRVIFGLPAAQADTVLPLLDRQAQLMREVG